MQKKSEVLETALQLYRQGFAIHWLRPKSKIPVEGGWTTGPRKTWRELRENYHAGYNIGVRLGTPSKIEGAGYLAVIDVDVKSESRKHRGEAIAAAWRVLGDLSSIPRVDSGRGNGSRHYYVVTKKPFKCFTPARSQDEVKVLMPSKKTSKREIELLSHTEITQGWRLSPAWEVSLYSEGRQVVLPPSIHPDTGKPYAWKRPMVRGPKIPVLPLSTALPATSPANTALRPAEITLEGFQAVPVEISWLPVSEDVKAAILHGEGVTDRSGYLMKASSALFSAGLSQNEVLSVLTDPSTYLGVVGYEHAKTSSRRRAAEWVHRYTVGKVAREREGKTEAGESVFAKAPLPTRKLSPEEIEAQAAEFKTERSWKQDLDRTEKGHARTTLKNLDLIFTHGVKGNVFVEDLFASRIEYGVDTPWGGKAKTYIQDIDMIRVKRWLSDTEFRIEPPTAAILEATSLVADRLRIHPVREWLEGLKWDGVKRVNTWIKDYCEAHAEEPYLSEVSRKFLLAMVKRVFEPGCQWDYVLVLEGKQGKYKSSAARAIAGDKWFMDNLPDLKDKDSMLNLQGKWLIELGELADVKRADYNLVKAYLVRRTDTVRPHYGRLKADVPRQSVFIGTINEGQYLRDPTGNRRYWPVKVGLCDIKALTEVREQLFAEAMHLYRTTEEVLMLGPKADKQATRAQEDRRVDDDESEMREAFLAFRANGAGEKFDFSKFKTRDLMVGVNAPWGSWSSPSRNGGLPVQIAAQVLTRLGYERHKIEGQRYWRKSVAKSGARGGASLRPLPRKDFF